MGGRNAEMLNKRAGPSLPLQQPHLGCFLKLMRPLLLTLGEERAALLLQLLALVSREGNSSALLFTHGRLCAPDLWQQCF